MEAILCSDCGTEFAAETEVEPVVDNEASQWILKTFEWALEQFGTDEFYQRTVLVTPSREHFPDPVTKDSDLATVLFTRVKRYAGMEDWVCQLVAQEPDVDPCIAPTITLENSPAGPGGTFGVDESQVVITYNPNQLRDPRSLIAIFAHELAHYLGESAETPPPGGEKNWEYATDLLAVMMGFGIFLANSAVQFTQYQEGFTQGWASRAQGYLSESELVYVLAIFCLLKNIQWKQVEPHLKESLHSVFRAATMELERKPNDIEKLRSVRKSVNSNRDAS